MTQTETALANSEIDVVPPFVVGFSGRAGAGKSTAGEALRDMGFVDMAFAEPLKEAVRQVFGFTDEQLYGARKEEVDVWWDARITRIMALDGPLTPRLVLQLFGTEGMRRLFGPDIWVNALLRRIENSDATRIAVTDVRFPNEAEAIRRLGGVVIRIDRFPLKEAAHVSEVALDKYEHFAARITNFGSIEDFRFEVKSVVESLLP